MKRYVVINDNPWAAIGILLDAGTTKEQAINYAKTEWDKLSTDEKEFHASFTVIHAEVDEDDTVDYDDIDVVWKGPVQKVYSDLGVGLRTRRAESDY